MALEEGRRRLEGAQGMSGAFSWEPDDTLPGFDPANAWCLGHGREFVPYLREQIEASDDFAFIAGMDAAYPDPGEGRIRAPIVLFRCDDLKAEGAAAAALQTLRDDHGMGDPRLHLLPLRARMLRPDVDTGAMPALGEGATYTAGQSAPASLVGVIDHAINLAHARFRRSDGSSRIAFAWDQGGAADLAATVPFGQEWTAAEITGLIRNLKEDDRILRAMGALDFDRPGDRPLAYRQSHGTHVLDLAAGADPMDTEAQGSDILAVMLPPVVARESSGAVSSIFVLMGFAYLLQRSRDLNAAWKKGPDDAIPLYVNASLGLSGGPRGGHSLIEAGIDALIGEHEDLGGGPVTIVLPAGNRNLAQGHARGGAELSADWRLQPGDRTSNYLDVRIAGSGPVTLDLSPPSGGAMVQVQLATDDARSLTWQGQAIGRAVLESTDAGQLRLGIALAPTDPADSGRCPAPSGCWKLKVSVPDNTAQIEAWVLRDDSPPGFSDGGRQSYLDDLNYRRFTKFGDYMVDDPDNPDDPDETSAVKRCGALNAIATTQGRIVIGGHSLRQSERAKSTQPAMYSAGPLQKTRTLSGHEAVTVAAVSDRSRALGGVLGAATRSGGALPMDGTSVAAPQAVRLLAEARVLPEDAAVFLQNAIAFDPAQKLAKARGGAGGLPLVHRRPPPGR